MADIHTGEMPIDASVKQIAVMGKTASAFLTTDGKLYAAGASTSISQDFSAQTGQGFTVPSLLNFEKVTNIWAQKGGNYRYMASSINTFANRGSSIWIEDEGNFVINIQGRGGINFKSPIRLRSGNAVLLENGDLWVYGSTTVELNYSTTVADAGWYKINMAGVSGWDPAFVTQMGYQHSNSINYTNILIWVDSRTPNQIRRTYWNTAVTQAPTVSQISEPTPNGQPLDDITSPVFSSSNLTTFYYLSGGKFYESRASIITSPPVLPDQPSQSPDDAYFTTLFSGEGQATSSDYGYGPRHYCFTSDGRVFGGGYNYDQSLDGSTDVVVPFREVETFNGAKQIAVGSSFQVAIY